MAYEIVGIIYTCPNDSLEGDAIYISGSRTVSYADVDDPTKYAYSVILKKLSSTTCLIANQYTVIGGLVGLTAGSFYYLTSTATAGNTISTTESSWQIGIAISTTELVVNCKIGIQWDDLVVPLDRAGTGGGGNAPTWATISGGVQAWRFDEGVTDVLYFSAQLPHSYKEGTTIYPHLHILADANPGANNKAKWTLEYFWSNIDGAAIAGTTTDPILYTVGAADALVHRILDFTAIVGTNMKVSSILQCTLSRLGADGADTYAGNIFALSFDVHFQKDTNGSNARSVK